MFDAVTRWMLNRLPLPQTAGTSNAQLAFCARVQAELARCQARTDALFVLFGNGKYEECALLAGEAVARLTALRETVVQALAEVRAGSAAPAEAGLDNLGRLAALATAPGDALSEERVRTLGFFLKALRQALADTKRLYRRYRNQLPVFAEHYAWIGKKLVPLLAAILLVGVFLGGVYASKRFATFKDQDIRFDWTSLAVHPRVVITGLELPERGEGNVKYAWGHGPRTSVAFNSPGSYQFELDVQAVPCLAGQSIDVVINGVTVHRFTQATKDCMPSGPPEKILFTALKGVNLIDLVYSDWNMKDVQHFTGEPRPLAARLYAFSLKRTYEP